MRNCRGIVGWAFGHWYRARYSERARVANEATGASCTREEKIYEGDVCQWCGSRIEPVRGRPDIDFSPPDSSIQDVPSQNGGSNRIRTGW
jgi:hypothetical protein